MHINAVFEELNLRFLLLNENDSLHNNNNELFKQLNLSYWSYLDDFADIYSHLPKLSLKAFCKKMFEVVLSLQPFLPQFDSLFQDFIRARDRTPVAGLILLNKKMNKVVLVCSYNSKNWGFPKGKLEEGEDLLECAIRETEEETGFNATDFIHHPAAENCISIPFKEKTLTLFIAKDVPEDTVFETKTKKEISAIQFFKIHRIPEHWEPIYQIIGRLKQWIMAFKAKSGSLNSPAREANKYESNKKKRRAPSSPQEFPASTIVFEPLPFPLFAFDVRSIMLDVDRVLFEKNSTRSTPKDCLE